MIEDLVRFPYSGPPELLPEIVESLSRVVDPEVALDIVNLGLVYGVTVAEGRMDVNVTMTTAACPVTDMIVSEIENELDAAMPEDMLIHVEVVWDPPWTPDRMSERAKAFMGW